MPAAKRRELSPDVEERAPPRQGLRWDAVNWSCAYDCILTIIWNSMLELGDEWFNRLSRDTVACHLLYTRMSAHPRNGAALEPIRDALRDVLHLFDPVSFPRGRSMAAVTDVILAVLTRSEPFGVSVAVCSVCSEEFQRSTDVCSSMLWTVLPDLLQRLPPRRSLPSSQAIVDGLLTAGYPIRCPSCRSPCDIRTTVLSAPPIICLDVTNIEGMRASERISIPINSVPQQWTLCGVIYHGFQHFTCRFIASDGTVWYHDGVTTAQYCVKEANAIREVDLISTRGCRATQYIYAYAGDGPA
ncbi:hypothetical protein FKP32DRAFT_1572229 [Trametes sanguinea]|nr:hypothetical protein FKP32DRAFT_1572229 [Trametes sanguinea]